MLPTSPTRLPLHACGPATGLPLVCLHGFLGRGTDFAPLARRLPGVRLVAPDLPGHGDATGVPRAAYLFEAAAEAVAATLDAEGIGQAALMGYSMGGRLALHLALAHPQRWTALVLESASPGLPDASARRERRSVDAERAEELRADLRRFVEAWYDLPLFRTLTRTQRARLANRRAAGQPDTLAEALVGMSTGAQPDLWPRLAGLAVPTVAMAGAEDEKFVGIAERMARASPRVRALAIDGAGHNVHVERPEAWAAVVRMALAGAS